MSKYRLYLFVLLALVSLGNALAQQASTDDEAQVISGEIALGIGALSDDSYRFGRYSGIVDQGVAPLFSLQLQTQPVWMSEDSRYAWFDIDYIGAESIRAFGEIGVVGQRKAALEFRKLSNFLYRETESPFAGKSVLDLPNTWQVSGNTTQSFDTLDSALQGAPLQTQRDRWRFDFTNLFLPTDWIDKGWDTHFSYRHDNKQGRRALAGTIGTTAGNARAALLAVPVDFETDVIELGVQKNSAAYYYGLRYSASYFTNEMTQVTWRNPFGAVAQWASNVAYPDGGGQLALEPDNSAQQLGLNAAWYVGRSSIHLDASRGKMTQDEDFLPYTVNPNLIVNTALPDNDLSGEIDTTYLNVRWVTRPTDKLNVVARYRLDDRDNATSQYTFIPITGDAENQGTLSDGRINRPYSYRQQSVQIDSNYRLSRGLRLTLGAEQEEIGRDFSEVDQTEEITWRAGIAVMRWQSLNVSFNLSTAERDSDLYVGNRPFIATHVPGTVGPTDFENHPLLRKYYLSNREREQTQVRTDWYLVSDASIGFSAAYNRDQYDDDFFGLHDATMLSLLVDGNYQLSDSLQLTAFLSRDSYDSNQAGRSYTSTPGQINDPARDWDVSSDDEFSNAGFALEWQGVPIPMSPLPASWRGEVDTGIELLYSRSESVVDTRTGSALILTPLPDVNTRLKSYRWYFRWQLPSNARIDFSVTHESYQSDDFAFTNVGPTTVENVLTLGELNPNYSLNWFTLAYRLPF